MEKPIFDPPIPYIGAISGGRFSPGKMVKIQGIVPGVAYRFDINLQCGPESTPRDDVAIQVSVRILDGYISLNSLHNGIWGEEQRGTVLPINRAQKFEIILLCDFNRYKISINGQQDYEFPQRIHYDRITHLAIDGDVSITQISYPSASEGGMGAASRSGLATTSHPSAPTSVPSVENEFDDFERIEMSTNRAPPLGIHSPPSPGFSKPPSYEAALDASNRPPYPTGNVTGMPCPASNGTGMPYPTTGIGFTGISSHPPPAAPGISPSNAPLNAGTRPVPLNAGTSTFLPSYRYGERCDSTRKCAGIFTALLVIGMIIYAYVRYNLAHKNW